MVFNSINSNENLEENNMKYYETTISGKLGILIYVSAEEDKDILIQARIDELKKLYKKVAIFVSGSEPMEVTLKKIAHLYSE